jgi:hypothetical protein
LSGFPSHLFQNLDNILCCSFVGSITKWLALAMESK